MLLHAQGAQASTLGAGQHAGRPAQVQFRRPMRGAPAAGGTGAARRRRRPWSPPCAAPRTRRPHPLQAGSHRGWVRLQVANWWQRSVAAPHTACEPCRAVTHRTPPRCSQMLASGRHGQAAARSAARQAAWGQGAGRGAKVGAAPALPRQTALNPTACLLKVRCPPSRSTWSCAAARTRCSAAAACCRISCSQPMNCSAFLSSSAACASCSEVQVHLHRVDGSCTSATLEF